MQSTGWPHPDGTRPTINREDREQGHTESVGKENRQQETGQVQTKAEDQPKDTRDKHKASTAKAKGRGMKSVTTGPAPNAKQQGKTKNNIQ